jgi:hypothetical protein
VEGRARKAGGFSLSDSDNLISFNVEAVDESVDLCGCQKFCTMKIKLMIAFSAVFTRIFLESAEIYIVILLNKNYLRIVGF